MADTGYNWGSWAFVQDAEPSDWNAEALADNGDETSGTAISLDGKAACIVGIGLTEDNTGAIDGVVTVYVLGETDVAYEAIGAGNPWQFTITPVQNDTVYTQFSISPAHYDNFKIAADVARRRVESAQSAKRRHPWAQAAGWFAEPCEAFAPEGGTVLDPFAGAGTTLVDAAAVGRKAIGIEIEERYCEIAAKRCAQETINFEVVNG